MDEPTDPRDPANDEKSQIDTRRQERRARRNMRQTIAEAALNAAANAARDQGVTLDEDGTPVEGSGEQGNAAQRKAGTPAGKDPSFDNPVDPIAAPSRTDPEGEEQAQRQNNAYDEDEDEDQPPAPPRMTQLARIKPTSLQAPSAPGGMLSDPVASASDYEAAQAAREQRMRDIRKELRRRRRLRTLWILVRFLLFVALPTSVVGWYYYEKATDMYVSVSALVFKGAASGGDSGGGGLFGAASGTISNPAIDLQEFILSRDMLKRLENEHGYISHFQSEEIDEFHRLPADATFDDAYKYYRGTLLLSGKVEVSYDITEGIIRMEVVGATAEAAQRFSNAIIKYGEERVNDLNDRSRNDGVRLAEGNVDEAKQALIRAQENFNHVQESMNIFNTEVEAGALQGRITQTEQDLASIRSQIRKLDSTTNDPNDSRYVPLRLEERELELDLKDLRERLTGGAKDQGPSLSELNSQMNLANIELAAANLRYTSAITSLETAIQAASAQSLYLETVVRPNFAEDASRPDRLTNTALVFLILFATYILGLLTISVIREQAAI